MQTAHSVHYKTIKTIPINLIKQATGVFNSNKFKHQPSSHM